MFSLRILYLLILVLPSAALLSGALAAGTLHVDLLAGSGFRAGVSLEDLPVGSAGSGSRASLGLTWGASGAGPGAALYLRQTSAFGPVGNLIMELRAAGSTNREFSASLVGRGVAGPAAVRFRLSAGNTGLGPALQLAGPPAEQFPQPSGFPGLRQGVELGVTYRVTPTLILLADPGVQFREAGVSWHLHLEARLLRQAGRDDLIIALEGVKLQREEGGGHAALRLSRQLNPRRAAPWTVSVLFGGGPDYVGPGFRLQGSSVLTGGSEVTLAASLEPWRTDRAPVDFQLELREGPLLLGSALQWGAAGVNASARVSYRLPLP